ncbi:MAG: hypothetical protein GKC10_01635 [Methanosarcinales archaeon]|nr:hypothetical protein [Methanosarcinales archaeon]
MRIKLLLIALLLASTVASASTGRVLFDETRPQPYQSNGVVVPDTAYNLIAEEAWWGGSDLASLLRDDGFEVSSISERPLTAEKLRGFDVLVAILSNDDYTSSEIEAIYNFVQEGGGLFLVPNAWFGRESYSINGIAQRFGVSYAKDGALMDLTSNYREIPLIIKVEDITAHPITTGVHSLMSGYSTYLEEIDGSQVLARTSSNAWFDIYLLNSEGELNQQKDASEPSESFPVLAVQESGQGRVVYFTGFVLDNDQLVLGDNAVFSLNAFRWLAGQEIPAAGAGSASPAAGTGTGATTNPVQPSATVPSPAVSTSAPATISRPGTGTFIKSLNEDGNGEMLIKNGLADDAVVVLTRPSGAALFSVYVRSGDQFRVQGIPDGSYTMFFTSGADWDYVKKEFTRAQDYFSMEGTMSFSTTTNWEGTSYTIHEITLHQVEDGNMERLSVNKEDFPQVA